MGRVGIFSLNFIKMAGSVPVAMAIYRKWSKEDKNGISVLL
jgi:hypothetical protein